MQPRPMGGPLSAINPRSDDNPSGLLSFASCQFLLTVVSHGAAVGHIIQSPLPSPLILPLLVGLGWSHAWLHMGHRVVLEEGVERTSAFFLFVLFLIFY